MKGHDIIVIGSSAGGIKALRTILTNLPADINAAIFIVQHLSANSPSFLPEILADVGSLPVVHPDAEEQFEIGKIYVARPRLSPFDRSRARACSARAHKRTGSGRLSMLCSAQPPGLTAQEFWV